MKVFITGVAGTGKTTILSEIQKHGFVVIDLDATGMCRWRNSSTHEITEYGFDGRSKEWLNEHEWYCDVEVLKKLLSCIREDRKVFVAGVVGNIAEVAAEFDKVFLLNVPDEELKKRLSTRTNNHFAKSDEEQEAVLSWRGELVSKLQNFVEVDANKSPDKTAEFILDNAN